MSFSERVREVTDALPTVHSTDVSTLIDRLSVLSLRGLGTMYEPRSRSFPHTLHVGVGNRPPVARGMSVRYTAIAALGLSRVGPSAARDVLQGQEVPVLLPGILGLALAGRDPGALALSVWASLDVATSHGDEALAAETERLSRALDRLVERTHSALPAPTVEHAWTLVALLSAHESRVVAELPGGVGHLAEAADAVARQLLAAQAATGLFPHCVPPDGLSRFRSHVACFADQAYCIQALARYAAAAGNDAALEAANRCADRLAALQGDEGQWWWHYDWARGTVVERYPVYSVNQHGLAPMALMELWESGGVDHRSAVARGLGWLVEHPETTTNLISDELGVVWRKVGRHEPSKLVRKARSAASARSPRRRLPWLDVVFPPRWVDPECRPFELGWLLYAWQPPALPVSPHRNLSPEFSRMA